MKFNRSDNKLSHLEGHTKEGGKTAYFPEAEILLDELLAKRSRRKGKPLARHGGLVDDELD